MAQLEEWIQEQYLEYYEESDKYNNKQELLANKINGIFLKDGTKNYITYDGKMYYLINKSKLPNEVKEVLVGGDTLEFAKYVRLQDVYGLTDNLKVYYIDNESGTTYGNVEVENVDPNMPLAKSNQNKTAKDIVSKFLKEKYQITVDEELGITSGNITLLKELEIDGNEISTSEKESFKNNFDFIGELNALQKLTLKNLELSNFNGIESCSLLNYIYLDNCKISDYSKLSQVLDLKELYFHFPNKLSENEANGEIDKLGIGLQKADDLHSLTNFGISGNFYFDHDLVTYEFKYNNIDNAVGSKNFNLGSYVENTRSNFSSINGLSNFSKSIKSSITNLYLNNNNLKSIEILKDFTGINKFQIMGNPNLTSLAGLENKTNLEYLVAQNSGIKKKGTETDFLGIQDISGLDGCSKLYYLSLKGNSNLESLEGLSKCSNLYFLLCDNCNISNIEALVGAENKGLTKLEFLYLENNSNLEDISSLKKCSNIKNLYLAGITVLDENVLVSKEFQDIIKNCKNNYSLDNKYSLLFLNVEKLTLSDATDDQLKLLKGKTGLKALNLSKCSKLSSNVLNEVLPTLTGMVDLNLWGVSNLVDLSFVESMSELVALDLRETPVSDLSSLENLAKADSFKLGTLIIDNGNINLSSIQTVINKVSITNSRGGYNLLNEKISSCGMILIGEDLCDKVQFCSNLTCFCAYYGDSAIESCKEPSKYVLDFSGNSLSFSLISIRCFRGTVRFPTIVNEVIFDACSCSVDVGSCVSLKNLRIAWAGGEIILKSLLDSLDINFKISNLILDNLSGTGSSLDLSRLAGASLQNLSIHDIGGINEISFNSSFSNLNKLEIYNCMSLGDLNRSWKFSKFYYFRLT